MANRLLLIRHGEAVDAGPDVNDGGRWLTAHGRAETARTGKYLQGHPPTALITSPLVRAVQTAEIVATFATPDGPITVLPALALGDVAAIVRFVAAWSGDGHPALVGHEPTLSEVVVALLKHRRWPGFEKSAAVALAREGEVWRFEWMFLPSSGATTTHIPG